MVLKVFLFAVRNISTREHNVFYSQSEIILFANRNIFPFVEQR